MPRKPTLKSRSNKIKKSFKQKHSSFSKTIYPSVFKNFELKYNSKQSTDYLDTIRSFLDKLLFLHQPLPIMAKKQQIVRAFVRRVVIPASYFKRVLSWKQQTTTLIDSIINSSDYDPKFNFLEATMNLICENLKTRSDVIKDNHISIQQHVFFCSPQIPFLGGTADILFTNSSKQNLLIIECKLIQSESEFRKIFPVHNDSLIIANQNHEYIVQLETYLNIFECPVGILLVEHKNVYTICFCYHKTIPKQTWEKLKQFYFGFLLPRYILSSNPKPKNGKIEFLNEAELQKVYSYLNVVKEYHSFVNYEEEIMKSPDFTETLRYTH